MTDWPHHPLTSHPWPHMTAAGLCLRGERALLALLITLHRGWPCHPLCSALLCLLYSALLTLQGPCAPDLLPCRQEHAIFMIYLPFLGWCVYTRMCMVSREPPCPALGACVQPG